jgi:hypothetical protein
MTKILDRLPVLAERKEESFGERYAHVKRDQILVWVSLHFRGVLPEVSTRRIPALLDTGNNFDFSLQERHVQEWTGIDLASLPYFGPIEINDRRVDRYEASVWLHPNIPGTRKAADDRLPFLLEMPRGIAVYPHHDTSPGPRLPLVGLPALFQNDLDFFLDPDLRQVTVQTRTWRRWFMRLLTK